MGELWMAGVPNVSQQVMSAMLRPEPSFRGETFGPLLERIIKNMQKIMQTKNDIVVMTSSGTGGLEACGINFFKPSDNVIVPVCGLFSGMLCEYVRNAGANVIKVESPVGDEPSLEQIKDAFKKAGNVKALFSVYDETSTGVTMTWLKEAGELCEKYGSFFIVDAHASFSTNELPVDKWGIDICVTGSQLSLGGPAGLCFLSVSEKAKRYLADNPPKSVYFSIPYYLSWQKIGQPPFSPATTVMLATDEALNLLLEEGLEVRIKRNAICAKAYYSAFEAIGVEPLVKRKELRSNYIPAFKVPDGIDGRELRKLLDNKYGIYVVFNAPGCPPSFRIVPIGPDPSFREGSVLATVTCVASALNLLGYKNDMGKAIEAAHEVLKDYPTWGKKEYDPVSWGWRLETQK